MSTVGSKERLERDSKEKEKEKRREELEGGERTTGKRIDSKKMIGLTKDRIRK